ncbi:hypothetical protein HMPREF1181_00866 [Bacteroides stercoris CC31F]|uniref:Uncharacterized protein n=1 Tax=Bacteroides stercoris CC31F TaxID=1073351 RepID=S3YUL0_BACSE|nr:hypothetical protein HMPREF1181_00866 [Bacteroides stercoris CC31F]
MYRAIPIKWKVSGLNTSKSEIVVKTITLRHTIQGYFINMKSPDGSRGHLSNE